MRRAGVFLIFIAVTLRIIISYVDDDTFGLVMGALALYGVLLFIEEWQAPRYEADHSRKYQTLMVVYLVLQLALVILLLSVDPQEDFALLLLPPLALQAVFAYGWQAGRIWIAIFCLASIPPMAIKEEEQAIGAVMAIFYGVVSLLLGRYAHLTQKSNQIRNENQKLLFELQTAHEQLKGFANQREELATEQERTRLARELHDSVTQTVFSMNLAVQSTRMMLEKDLPRAAGQLDRLQELSRSALAEIQRLVAELQQLPANDEDLQKSLNHLVDEKQRKLGLSIELNILGDRELSTPVKEGLLRITTEALINIHKHAGVKEAWITLDLESKPAFLEIEDHGVGFNDQEGAKKGHLGLVSMKERAEEIGWKLSVRSNSKTGTLVQIEEKRESGDES
jgi:signal transduction histidine kinase